MTAQRSGVGIIGCGAVVQQVYRATLLRLPGIKIAYVFDVDRDAGERMATAFRARRADNLEMLLDGVATAIIATPPSTHEDLVRRCLQSGVDVICEKPFVGTGAAAERLVAEAQRRARRLMVGHFRRTFPSVRFVRALVGSGSLGSVRAIRLAEGGRFKWVAASGYVSRDPFGGVLFDTGSHTLDMALFGAGLDEADLAIAVDEVERDRAEPSHELRSVFRTWRGGQSIRWDLRLSRYQALANRITIELEGGAIVMSVAPRDRVRVIGPTGTVIIPVSGFSPRLEDYFLRQWHEILEAGEGDIFEGRRFVTLSRILEAVATKGRS